MVKRKFTIITVCYNAEKYIRDTVYSVLSQSFGNFEYIIKDGGSEDETMNIVHGLTDQDDRVTVIHETDRGIYDAMNIAVSTAEGEYIFFLNAGDKFADQDVLGRIAEKIKDDDAGIFYGNIIEIFENKSHLRIYTEKNSKMWYYSLGACLCHQGMICKRELFREKLFNLDYKVCADRDWQMYHISRGIAAKPLNFTIAEVLANGFSQDHKKELEEETKRCVKEYCGRWNTLYQIIEGAKKNRYLCRVIRKTEQMVSCR